MSDNSRRAVARDYVNKVNGIGALRQAGEDVGRDLHQIVGMACFHLPTLKPEDPKLGIREFIGYLKLWLELAPEVQEKRVETLSLAIRLAQEHMDRLPD